MCKGFLLNKKVTFFSVIHIYKQCVILLYIFLCSLCRCGLVMRAACLLTIFIHVFSQKDYNWLHFFTHSFISLCTPERKRLNEFIKICMWICNVDAWVYVFMYVWICIFYVIHAYKHTPFSFHSFIQKLVHYNSSEKICKIVYIRKRTTSATVHPFKQSCSHTLTLTPHHQNCCTNHLKAQLRKFHSYFARVWLLCTYTPLAQAKMQ